MSWTQHHRLLLKNGTIVTAVGRKQADVLVRDGTIEAVGPNLVGRSCGELFRPNVGPPFRP